MKIDRRTRMRSIMPLLTEERVQQLAEQVPCVPLDKPLLRMTCGEFIEALEADYPMRYLRERRVFTAFGHFRQYMEEMRSVTNYIKRCEVEQDADEKAAANGVNFPSLGERILVDCVRHFSLHSTAEAERIPLADWLLMLKSDSAAAQYQRNLSKIQSKKHHDTGRHR